MELTELETALAGNEPAIAAVREMHGRASRLTPEVEAELPKLGEYKSAHAALAKIITGTGAKDADALLTDFATIKANNADLVKQRDAWKAGGKGENSPEMLALKEQIEAGQKTLKEITDKMTTAEKEAADAKAQKLETDLRASVLSAAGKNKATEPEDIYILLRGRGLVGHGEDGKPFYYKTNEKGEKVAVASAEEQAAWLATARKDLFQGSGVGGVGGDHRGGDANTNGAVTQKTARAAFLASRGMK
jgi:hypothetical protein